MERAGDRLMTDLQVDPLVRHMVWADRQLYAALRAPPDPPAKAVELFGHVLGAEETWLARVQQRPPVLPVWPAASLDGYGAAMRRLHDAISAHLSGLADGGLATTVHYANSAGQEFDNTILDILVHMAMHGMYHRGQVNQLLREAGLAPAPMDYIGWRRGAPAATRDPPR